MKNMYSSHIGYNYVVKKYLISPLILGSSSFESQKMERPSISVISPTSPGALKDAPQVLPGQLSVCICSACCWPLMSAPCSASVFKVCGFAWKLWYSQNHLTSSSTSSIFHSLIRLFLYSHIYLNISMECLQYARCAEH